MGSRIVVAAVLGAAVLTSLGTVVPSAAAVSRTPSAPHTASACRLGNGVTHVVNIQFDNLHLTRDNPNVASDLEQLPALTGFLHANGVILANSHDVLIHTASNFVSNQTGLYPDRHGITQSNSGYYYDAAGKTHGNASFSYWTDPVVDFTGAAIDSRYNLDYWPDRTRPAPQVSQNVPAPWVPFTRSGCDVGEVGMAQTVLENTGSDITTVFGSGSAQAAAARANPVKAQADYVGLAVHCAQASSLCSAGRPDVLPDEPGGYSGFKALFGNAMIQPAISPAGPVTSTDGRVISDRAGNPGFPGFDSLTPDNSLAYGAQMLEAGVGAVNVYVSDAHTDHTPGNSGDFGPGEKGYEDQLAAYDRAFSTFIHRLAKDGLTPANTLFTFGSDEGDHFAGSAPTPAGCTGQPGSYCTYATKSEVNINSNGLLAAQRGNTTSYAIHNDPAPAFWLTGDPARTDAVTRTFGQDLAALTATDPYTGVTQPVAFTLGDVVEERILHFVSADPARTPTFSAFSGENSYVIGGPRACDPTRGCVYTTARYAWNHGGAWPDMQTIWTAYAGPGVKARGTDSSTWTDQTDMRPTTLALVGLKDDYQVDGFPLLQIMDLRVLSTAARAHRQQLIALGELDKQLGSSAGGFTMATLRMSTAGIKGDDATYRATEAALASLGEQRDLIVKQMQDDILEAVFADRTVPESDIKALTQADADLMARVS